MSYHNQIKSNQIMTDPSVTSAQGPSDMLVSARGVGCLQINVNISDRRLAGNRIRNIEKKKASFLPV